MRSVATAATKHMYHRPMLAPPCDRYAEWETPKIAPIEATMYFRISKIAPLRPYCGLGTKPGPGA